jgi:hypothetical protein
MQGTIILPTDHVIQEFYTYSQNMQSLDFDVYECVRIAIDALHFAQKYPQSFESEVSLAYESRGVSHMSIADINTLNQMMRMLYERLYCAFCVFRLYDQTGRLTHPYFELHHGDVVVSSAPFDNNPTT